VAAARQPVIQVAGCRKTYGRLVALDDVSFDVADGEIFGLIGPNGAGKTTTMECVEGLRRPDRGRISVLGLDPFRDVYALQQRIGVQLQQAQLQKRITVWEAVDFWASLYRRPRRDGERLLEQLGLVEKRKAWFMTLSGGQKQRLFIALALVNDPEVVFLDELTTGLDPQARRDTWQLIEDVRSRGVTILLVTHFMEEAERLCDRIALIDTGRVVVVDTPAGLTERVQTEQRIRFRPSVPFDEMLLTSLPDVTSVIHRGDVVVVTGNDNALNAVTSVLARNQILAHQLRVDQASLEDAFLALTGRHPEHSDSAQN
jgi:ABC-2 type transport system ATP-binding protein